MNLKENLGSIVLLVIVFALSCICLPLVLWKHSLSIDTFLRLSELLLSWPVAIIVIVVLLITRFHDAVDHFLRNCRVSLPGGAEIQSQQAAGDPPDQNELPAGCTILTAEQQQNINQLFTGLKNQTELDAGDIQRLNDELNRAYDLAIHWKFDYLNLFLVPMTKEVLFWFSQQTVSLSEATYNTSWQTLIPDQSQRTTILNVLVRFGSVTNVGNLISITQTGRGFLSFIGRLAPGERLY